MKQVTRDIDPEQAQDLLNRVPRACLAFASENGPILMPVDLTWREGRYLVRVAGRDLPTPGQEAVLLVDEGIYYFDLRAIYIRGEMQPRETEAGGAWFELVPTRTVAWDYGAMREVAE